MGIFSALEKLGEVVEDFNDAAEDVGRSTVTDYGVPEYSLYTARDLKDIHFRINVTDEEDNLKYYTKSSFFVLKGETDIMDASGKVIAHLEKKPISLHEIHYVTMADGLSFTMSNELFHIVDDITNIEELGWQIRGNTLGLSFNLLDESGEPIATIGKRMISLHSKYSIDIYQPEHEAVVVAIVIQLEKMIEARSENDSSSTVSFGN